MSDQQSVSRPSKKRSERSEGRPRRIMPWGELARPIRDKSIPPRDGLVVVDKDKDVTSHDIVGAMRYLAGTRKVGHAGTLDPMATKPSSSATTPGLLASNSSAMVAVLAIISGSSSSSPPPPKR